MNMNLDSSWELGTTFVRGTAREAIKLSQTDALQRKSYFLKQLQREKRRADRFRAPLSIALIWFSQREHNRFSRFKEVLETLQGNMREADLLGQLDDDCIGILLPDTDEKRLQDFKKRIFKHQINPPFRMIVGTYPDRLHELLAESQNSPIIDLLEGINETGIVKLSDTKQSLHFELPTKQYFLRCLRYEERRVDRSHTPLSVALIGVDNNKQQGERSNFEAVLELLQANIRETDLLGDLGQDCIGILLPNTDEKRMQNFKKRIVAGQKDPLFLITSGTYPNQLFHDLLAERRYQSDFYALFLNNLREPNRFRCFLKRVLDIVGSLIGILLFSPLMLIAALAIKLDSPGAVIFKQIRMGKNGTPFKLYKFRSMYRHADDRIHREYIGRLIQGNLEDIKQDDKEKPVYKIRSDPRVTRIGRILRKTSIDELPQLFNVLKGEMSLVGPRPPLAYEVEKYQSWHLMRILEMRPGITGLWQVGGRSETAFDDMVRLDIRYIRKWSLMLDVKILLKTIKAVLRSSGAF